MQQGRVKIGGNSRKGYTVYILKDGEYTKIQNGEFPVVGRGVNGELITDSSETDSVYESKNVWDGWNRLEYGLGLGLGLDVWKLQIIGRYNWNFGTLLGADGKLPAFENVVSNVKSSVLEGNNFGGVTLTVALLF